MNSSKVNYESTVIAFTQINFGAQPLTGYFGFHNCQHMPKSLITIKIKHHSIKMRTTTSSCLQANSTSFHNKHKRWSWKVLIQCKRLVHQPSYRVQH